MRQTILCLLSFCFLVLSVSGCGSGAYKKDMEFTYILSEDISSLDPQTCKLDSEKAVISMIFEGLCRLDSTGNATPGVATEWVSNAEYTRWTFYLREDAVWSNGDPLTAEDFVFGVRRALTPSSKAVGIETMFIINNAYAVNNGEADPETLGVYAPDSQTVVFELNASCQEFPKLTAGTRFMPCQQKYFEETVGHYGMDCIYTLTNGPFTFRTNYSWDPGVSLKLVRTINHVGETEVLPEYINLLLSANSVNVTDPVQALKNETVDLIELTRDEVDAAQSSNCEVITVNDSVYGLMLNMKNDKLTDAALREIYLSSIDRKEVISRMGEQYEEALGIMPRCIRWNGESYQQLGEIMYAQQNTDIADLIPSLLTSLDLNELPTITIICLNDEYSKHLANGIIVSWNKNLPNMFNLEPLDEETYNSRLQSGDYEAALYSFSAKGTMPLSVFAQFSSTADPQLLADESYDELLKTISFTHTGFQDMEKELINRYVFYPIHYMQSFYGVNPKAKNIVVTADLGVDFTQAIKRDT